MQTLGAIADITRVSRSAVVSQYNIQTLVQIYGTTQGRDLGAVAAEIQKVVDETASQVPKGSQVVPMRQMFKGLGTGLGLAVLVIFLLLTAYFQSPRLALVAVTTVPAVLAGVALALFVTRTTLNLQSFMGAIMAIGVAVANAILLVTFAERSRVAGREPWEAAIEGARSRLRPILMTSFAMLAGMVPMALGLGEGGGQSAPLGRAVIGGLIGATCATLVILPAIFATLQSRRAQISASLDPNDPQSRYFEPEPRLVEVLVGNGRAERKAAD